jgi:hypothetical protein
MPAIAAAISAAASAFAATAVGTFLTQNFFGRLLVSVALSALQRALTPKPRAPGIRVGNTLTGGTQPASFILGRFATAGVAVCPAMSHGKVGKTPNAYLTYVIELGDIPGMTLDEVICDGEVVTFGGTPEPDYGMRAQGPFTDYLFVKYYDGTQTAADPMLLSRYGSYPERPWTSDMVGTGICYVIVTMRYNRELFQGFPKLRFVLGGIPLYDPRKDSTNGGAGPHRWANRATWEPSSNPVVQVYNIARGVTVAPGQVWGGSYAAADVPSAVWIAEANKADQLVTLQAGGSEPRYRTAFEVLTSDEPASVIEELLKGCAGAIADIGGVLKLRVGGPGLPVFFFDDADTLVTKGAEFDPHPGFDRTFNGVTATYPDPESLWEPAEAPPRTNATWEAEDGGRRLVASLQFDAVPHKVQVQRLMRAYIRDERRFRRHAVPLGPRAIVVEPLDTVSWTSPANGYVAKAFEVGSVTEPVRTLLPMLALRESDPSDYDWTASDELPSAVGRPRRVRPPAQTVPSFAVSGILIEDADDNGRQPALRLTWDGSELDGVEGIAWQVRIAGKTAVALSGSTTRVEDGARNVSAGVLPWADYQVRARLVARWATTWTAWLPASTLGVAEADPSNLFPDYDLQRAGIWTPSALDAPAQFAGTDIDECGLRLVRILPQAGTGALQSTWFRCQPVAHYEASVMASMSSGVAGGGTAVALVEFGQADAAGVITMTRSLTIGSRTDSASTVRHELNILTGKEEKWFRFRLRRIGGGTENARFGGPRLARRAARNLIVDGEVTGPKMAASGIITATAQLDDGVVTNTKISGAIQSDNWVAGSVGWRIAKGGSAEFNNLIVRGWLQVGAVSDILQEAATGPFFAPDTYTIRATLDLGATDRGSIYQRGVVFEARATGAQTLIVTLQRRSRELGGAFTAWETIETWNVTAAAWGVYADSGTLAGFYDDFEYRLGTQVTGGVGAYAAVQVIRNIRLTAVLVTR